VVENTLRQITAFKMVYIFTHITVGNIKQDPLDSMKFSAG